MQAQKRRPGKDAGRDWISAAEANKLKDCQKKIS